MNGFNYFPIKVERLYDGDILLARVIPINLSGSSTFYGPNFEGIYGSISSDKNTI